MCIFRNFISFQCQAVNLNFSYCKWMGRTYKCQDILKPIMTDEGLCYNFNMFDVYDINTDEVWVHSIDEDENSSFILNLWIFQLKNCEFQHIFQWKSWMIWMFPFSIINEITGQHFLSLFLYILSRCSSPAKQIIQWSWILWSPWLLFENGSNLLVTQ